LLKFCIFRSTAALPIELSSQWRLVASLIQFKCTKYFRDDLTIVLEDAQCFNSISEPFLEKRKTSLISYYSDTAIDQRKNYLARAGFELSSQPGMVRAGNEIFS
jgi:hypothetical protein